MEAQIWLSYFFTVFVSALLIPVVKHVSEKLNIIAQTNERTIHSGTITRIGGLAIYLTFLLGAVVFLKADQQINSILIGGFLIFIMGLYDDMYDLKPKYKLLIQLLAAFIVIFYGGIRIRGFNPEFLSTEMGWIVAFIVTIGWIIGITNAINLIDGLDGLCAGICIIVLSTISLTSSLTGRSDIASLSFVLAGSITGFLFYNFHPATIFMGDSGSQFIGFMISAISLLGFGYESSTFFALGAPIVVLTVPIMDTVIAIIRRKIHHQKFSVADKKHLHHNLMFTLKLGQKKSVLTLYGATLLFSLTSFLYFYNPLAGLVLFVLLLVVFEIFVEYTEMIDRRYRPILGISNRLLKKMRSKNNGNVDEK